MAECKKPKIFSFWAETAEQLFSKRHGKANKVIMAQELDVNYVLEATLHCIPFILRMLYLWVLELFYCIIPYSLWPDKINFKDKLVLITGAVGGLGRCYAVEFAKRGAKLILWDMGQSQLVELKKHLEEKYSIQVFIKALDITDDKAVASAAAETKSQIGVPDVLFNNAGILGYYKEFIFPIETYDKVLAVNARAPVVIIKNFIDEMLARNSGYLVTTSSFSGHIGVGVCNPYVTSKHCITGFMNSFRHFLKTRKRNIKCLTICPNYIKTPLVAGVKYENPLNPMLEPEYAAERAIQALECGQEELFLPKATWVFVLMKGIMPTKVFDVYVEMFSLHGSIN
ncbi:unnamed protein product [Bursaphelenchus xylophilus]|uniref:(pine wood nematode) hypothetical protein n=1 Tax=Bursaphelenchus xylophilus TaxID=6326 RepID=A0A1I7SLF2_BURXY|nr:unnamed protein product [Bursaphelenchus xylophilus]CAG9129548.1 unnamed protein product [Bursaphelenchus xylophilus]